MSEDSAEAIARGLTRPSEHRSALGTSLLGVAGLAPITAVLIVATAQDEHFSSPIPLGLFAVGAACLALSTYVFRSSRVRLSELLERLRKVRWHNPIAWRGFGGQTAVAPDTERVARRQAAHDVIAGLTGYKD